MLDFPVVSYFGGAFAELDGKRIWISTLNSTALLLVTQGANGILVPPLENGDAVARSIQGLSPSLRLKVKMVDANSSILKRVTRFVEPIEKSVETQETSSPERTLARISVPFLYQLAIAAKYHAGMTDGWIRDVTHTLHQVDFNKFRERESRYRLAELASIIISYRPFVSSRTGIRGDVADASIRGRLSDMLDTSEFATVVDRSGYLGLVRRPYVALRRLRNSVVRLANSAQFRGVAKATSAISSLAGIPLPVDSVSELAGGLEKGDRFSPPILDTSPYLLDIYKSTLSEYNSDCRPPKGSMFEMHVHQPAVCGAVAIDAHPKPKKYNQKENEQALLNCHLTAQEAVHNFLRVNT